MSSSTRPGGACSSDGSRLEPLESRIDSSPAGADEIDEESEIVHACMPLGEELALEPLEPADGLVQKTADLGDVPRDGKDLGAQAVADRLADVHRNRRLELGRRGGECLDLVARALEGGFDRRGLGASGGGVRDSLLRALQGKGVHGRRGYSPRRMDTELLDYELPPELVAQQPVEPRDASRLLVYRRESGTIEHRTFAELPAVLDGELVVVNDTRVVPGRLRLRRATGGAVEVLLVEQLDDDGTWEALVKPSSRLRADEMLGPVRLARAARRRALAGRAPRASQPARYRSRRTSTKRSQIRSGTRRCTRAPRGSAAAPTAGLHLTPALLARLDAVRITLHVGLDTFRPVLAATLEEHELHGERYAVDADAWERIAAARRVLAVGTTTVRALETVARTGELTGRATLFITPGFHFRRVDALVTNFHLPRSTLLALVMAFVGVDETRRIYREAIAERYRFYSFGDAMVVL